MYMRTLLTVDKFRVSEMDPAVAAELEGLSHQHVMNQAMAYGDSEVQRFYDGLTLFLTGGSGFIGKQLIEKLFRSCNIRKVFVLIRPKKDKATKERLQDMLEDPVFEAVRKKKPNFEEKVVAVQGDVAELGLGMSLEDWKIVTEEVDMIFHVAATIRFDEAIRLATLINIRGTRETLKLGRACKKLKSFVHVSTAYSHTTSGKVGGDLMEQFYACPVPPDVMINLAQKNDDQLEKVTENSRKDWPNTYTFTKAIAEEVVRTESEDMRVVIVRPSIVLCSYVEPTPGWLDISCMYGPSGIVVGVGLGVIRVLFVDNKAKLSFVPVDYVNNATIVAGFDAAVRPTNDIAIYNISTTNCGVTFRHISEPMRDRCRTVVSPLALWYLYLVETNHKVFYWIMSWLLHYIPAYTVDAAIKLFNLKKPKQLKSFVHVYKKYDKMTKVFKFFLTNEWNFDETNLTNLWNRLSVTDKQIYNFEINTIDWDWFTLMWCIGVRKHIMKDGLKGSIKAAKRQKWLKLANYLVALIYVVITCYLLSLLYKIVYSLV